MAPAAHTSEPPANGNVDNGAAITTGVKVTVDAEKQVAGIAFWVPTTNTGTYTVGLYETTSDDDPDGSGTGTELATASVGSGSVTADGWAEVLFASPVTLSTGTIYTAARHASSGRYVSTSGTFSAAGITGNGVTLIQSGTDPTPPGLGTMRNGTFVEGAALAYPNSSFGAADYFVDVVLVADSATGEIAATLPALTASIAGSPASDGAFAATLPAIAASLAADPASAGTVTATLPALVASLAATAAADATLTATLPALTSAFADTVTAAARSTPAVTAAYTSSTAVTAGRASTPAVSARRTSTATVG